MGFKFQINSDIDFNHNESLLRKADSYKPIIYKHTVKVQRLVKIIEDDSKLDNIGTEIIDQGDNLHQHYMTRDDKMILDFGKHYVGSFSMNINHIGSPMDAPLSFKIKFAEMPNELKYNSEDYDGWLSKSWIQEEIIHIDHLPFKMDMPRRYSFRYVEISVIDTSPKWYVSFDNATAEVQSAVSVDDSQEFNSNDSVLNKIYDVGVSTLADCMQDVFEDGPKRDRRLWLGDLRLQSLSNYYTFNNTDLVKRCLYLFAGMTAKDNRIAANVFTDQKYLPDDTFMYDYSLFFISVLDDLQRHELDEDVLKDLYPIAKNQWQYMLKFISDDGQVIPEESYTTFVDWSDDFDKSTSAQAITIYTLKQLIHLASIYHDDDIKDFKEILLLLETYAKKNLFDERLGLFTSGKTKEINVSSQVWMVLAHVMDDDSNLKIMSRTVNDLFPVKGIATPYMYHHVTQALFEAGLKEDAISLLKSYWGKMIDLGADTYWEAFNPDDPDYSPYGSPIVNSYCHAWSCTPVYLLKKYLE